MSKGKYAVRAANRLAALDNELLREKSAEVDTLKKRVAQLEAELYEERRMRNSIVLQRAAELSTEQISIIKTKFEKSEAEHAETLRNVAVRVGIEVTDDSRISPNWYLADVLPLLVPKISEHQSVLEEIAFEGTDTDPREVRRHGAKRMSKSYTRRFSEDNLVTKLKQFNYDFNGSYGPLAFDSDDQDRPETEDK